MAEWMAGIPVVHRGLVFGLRTLEGLRAAFTEREVWIRGELTEGDIPDLPLRAMRKIPDTTFYLVVEDMLRPVGRRLFSGPVPDVEWLPMRQAFPVVLPPTVLPAVPEGRGGSMGELTLVPSGGIEAPNLLVTDADTWSGFARSSPRIRLEHLIFGHDPVHDRVVIRGSPLPPVPGIRYHAQDDVALPCGLRWELPVDPVTIRGLVPCRAGDLVLVSADGSFEVVPVSCFVRATRSAVRLTLGGDRRVRGGADG